MDEKEYVPIDEELIRDFDDIPEDEIVDVESTSMEDVVEDTIIIFGYSEHKSTYKNDNYLAIEAELHGEKVVINTGSEAVTAQCRAYRPFFPLKVRVGKKGRKYYLEKA